MAIPVIAAARALYATYKVGKKLSPAVKAYIKKKKRLAIQDAKIKSHRTHRFGDETPIFREYTRKTFGPKKKPMGKKGMADLKEARAKIEKKYGITNVGNLNQSRFAYKHGFRTIDKRDPFSGREVINKFKKSTEPDSSTNFGSPTSIRGQNKYMTDTVRNYRAVEKLQRQTYKRNLNVKKLEKVKRAALSARAKYLNSPSNWKRGGSGR